MRFPPWRVWRATRYPTVDLLFNYDRRGVEIINENEDHIDSLADHVDNYLIRLSSHVATDHDNDLLNYYIQCFSEFERIGDYAVNLTERAT